MLSPKLFGYPSKTDSLGFVSMPERRGLARLQNPCRRLIVFENNGLDRARRSYNETIVVSFSYGITSLKVVTPRIPDSEYFHMKGLPLLSRGVCTWILYDRPTRSHHRIDQVQRCGWQAPPRQQLLRGGSIYSFEQPIYLSKDGFLSQEVL